jgi:hypothetical protein
VQRDVIGFLVNIDADVDHLAVWQMDRFRQCTLDLAGA